MKTFKSKTSEGWRPERIYYQIQILKLLCLSPVGELRQHAVKQRRGLVCRVRDGGDWYESAAGGCSRQEDCLTPCSIQTIYVAVSDTWGPASVSTPSIPS